MMPPELTFHSKAGFCNLQITPAIVQREVYLAFTRMLRIWGAARIPMRGRCAAAHKPISGLLEEFGKMQYLAFSGDRNAALRKIDHRLYRK
jgi:hypothetical protein